MICSACGTANTGTAKFCAECGARLQSVCPACGLPVTPGAKFCAECGCAVAGPRGSLGGRQPLDDLMPESFGHAGLERRLVSVLFADLVGFTDLAEVRDPEAVRELLSQYFDTAREVIGRYGGTIEKFIGDAVMAVWGTPVAHEDDAERAIRAGLELIDSVGALATSSQVGQLSLRVGVTGGEAAVTIGATGQGMVAGDVVNTASRLQGAAQPNTLLVDAAARGAASSGVAFEDVGLIAMKGKADPVHAWRALRVVGGRGGMRRSDAVEASFVGREAEFRLLKDLLHATSREGRSRLVSVMGQAGIGKSRLAWELEKYVDGLVEPIYWHRGRSLAYGQGISFWALGEMVRNRAGIAETDDADTTRAKLDSMIEEYVLDEADRRWIRPHLASLLGLVSAGGQREQAFAAWRTLFERIADRGTTVLVFEDLQWADEGLLDFVDHVQEWSRSRPILVVALSRPELLDRRPAWGSGRRNFASIALDPLSEADMRALLDGLVPGLPENAMRTILARAEGIPLYAVETVRMLIDDGRLVQEGDRYRPTGRLDDVAIPATLHVLVASRLDALDPADRALMQAAAVLGQTFPVPAVAAVLGETESAVEARLRALAARELMALDVDPRSPERGQYGFTQAVIREVAYATLSRRDRRSRHLAAARYFEARGEDELAGVLAAQYVAAYHAAPEGPEGEATAAQARVALRGAAERAAGVHDYVGASALLEQAREVTVDLRERAILDERIGEHLESAARLEPAESALRRAVDAYAGMGDQVAAARASASLGQVLINQWRPAEAIPLLEQALAKLDLNAPDPTLAWTLASLARACMGAGDTDKAERWLDRAIVLAERSDNAQALVDALITRAWVAANRGRPREALATLIGSLDLARRFGLPHQELRAIHNLAAGQEDDPDRLRALYDLGVETARRYGLPSWLYGFEVGRMSFAFWTGNWDKAIAGATELEAAEVGPPFDGEVQRVHAGVHGARGEFDEAERLLDLARAGLDGLTKANDRAALDVAYAQLRLAEGRFVEAYEKGIASTVNPEAGNAGCEAAATAAYWLGDPRRLEHAWELLQTTAANPAQTKASRAEIEGLRAALRGDREVALRLLHDALESIEAQGIEPWRLWVEVVLVDVLGPDDPEARIIADRVRTRYRELGAEAWLAQLDRVTARGRARAAGGQRGAMPPVVEASRS